MFWALNLSPGKRYSQVVSKSFHLSMACLDLDNTDAEVVPIFVQWNKEKHIICNLSKNTVMQQSLDLNFQAGDEIVFYTKGKAIVHLTGYLIPEEDLPGLMSDDSEDDAEEKAAEDAKERLKALATKSMKRGLEEKTSKNKKQKLDSSATEELSDEDEDDEDFALEEESSEEDSEDDGDGEKGLESDSDESEEEMESSVEEKKESPKPITGKKAKQKESLGKPAKKDATPGKKAESVNGTPNQQSAKKKKQKDGTPQSKEDAESPKSETLQKKTLAGGVMIEDIKVGNGPIAKPGRMVSMYYVGRLKQNNKLFDSSLQGPGLKFRLGHNEVIKGWDLGVSGMKVGGKRRIICPPNMAYGSKGSPPVIPPHSSLVFEVELKGVH